MFHPLRSCCLGICCPYQPYRWGHQKCAFVFISFLGRQHSSFQMLTNSAHVQHTIKNTVTIANWNSKLWRKIIITTITLIVINYASEFRELFEANMCLYIYFNKILRYINRLKPNDPYMGRTATLTSKRCILYIYSTNIGTEHFKHALYSPIFYLQNAVCFIMLNCLVPVLFTFYIQGVLKLKKNNSSAKGLNLTTLKYT